MSTRPYVLLSCAMSIDGYIDDTSGTRLLLSNDDDFDRVDEVRAGCDAILVGSGTVRADDPRLLVRSPARHAERAERGVPSTPLKVALTEGGDLEPTARFFTTGDVSKLVYCASPALAVTRERLAGVATVIDAGDPFDLETVLADLGDRHVRRLMVEGGTGTHTRFLASGLVDELHIAVAPFFVGEPGAPRLVDGGHFPHGPDNPLHLAEARRLDGVVLLRYLTGRPTQD